MPNDLRKLKINEISLVDAGANVGSVSVLMKRAGVASNEMLKKVLKALGLSDAAVSEISQEEAMPLTMEQMEKALKELTEKTNGLEVAKSLSDTIGRISMAVSKAQDTPGFKLIEAEVAKLDKTDKRVGTLQEMVTEGLAKSATHDAYSANLNGDEQTKFEAMPMSEKDDYMEDNPVKGGEAEDEPADKPAKGGKPAPKKPSDVEKRLEIEIKKGADREVVIAKMVEESDIKKLMDNELKEFTGIAKRDVLAKSIYDLRKVDADSTNTLVATMKSMAATMKKADILFKAIGGDGNGEAAPGDKLEVMAKARASKDGISFKKAYGLVLDENPTLYEEYDKNQPKE